MATPGARPGTARARPDTFTYSVPPELDGRLAAGHAVIVPFGKRRTTGIVVALRRHTPVERTREVEGLVDAAPWLTPERIALARWLAAYYLAPFFDCLRLMLPPGALKEALRYRRTDAPIRADDGISDAELAVLGRFGRRRVLSEAAIRRGLSAAHARGLARALVDLTARGLIAPEGDDAPRRAGQRSERTVRLLVEDGAAWLPRLRALKPSPRADVLAYLSRPDVALPTPAEVAAAAGVSDAVVFGVVQAGLAIQTAPARLLATEVVPARVDALAAEALPGELGAARLLRALAAAPAPLPWDEAAALGGGEAAIAPLLARGLARAVEVPPAIAPTVRGARAREAELAARRAAPHAAALAFVAAEGGVAMARHVTAATAATARTLAELEAAGLVALGDRRVWRDPLAGAERQAPREIALTEGQRQAWEVVRSLLGEATWAAGLRGLPPVSFAARAPVCLVHGVTGSGKTELYLKAIEHVLFQGRQAIVLVPEIALTAQTIGRFAGRFLDRVGLWHSHMTDGERADTWQRALDGRLDVIVGSRSAVFAPLPRLGLIVVDEEHADAYKQGQTPRYHARDVASRRAALTGSLVMLGSATPSVESMWEAMRGHYRLVELPRRVAAPDPRAWRVGAAGGEGAGGAPLAAPPDVALPPVRVVDMREELRSGNATMFSRALRSALADVLAAGEQAILFLNRRGSATSVLCRDCGHLMACPRCDVPLTLHAAPSGGEVLRCHYCGHAEAPPMLCPCCASARIKRFGAGTERVEQATLELFPGVRTLRWDADTTTKRGSHAALLARFAGGRADVLIGTQMITKGLDLPLVTLVGVISADTALHFPDFRATERAYQILSQVAGRAGRSEAGGQVIFQTYDPDNAAIRYAANHDYAGFYAREIAFRERHRYPPWAKLVRLEIAAPTDKAAERSAKALAGELKEAIARLGLPATDLIGPSPAFFRRLRGKSRWTIVVRSLDPYPLLAAVALPPGWRVDVDPIDVL